MLTFGQNLYVAPYETEGVLCRKASINPSIDIGITTVKVKLSLMAHRIDMAMWQLNRIYSNHQPPHGAHKFRSRPFPKNQFNWQSV
jgi:hypothetical protein